METRTSTWKRVKRHEMEYIAKATKRFNAMMSYRDVALDMRVAPTEEKGSMYFQIRERYIGNHRTVDVEADGLWWVNGNFQWAKKNQ